MCPQRQEPPPGKRPVPQNLPALRPLQVQDVLYEQERLLSEQATPDIKWEGLRQNGRAYLNELGVAPLQVRRVTCGQVGFVGGGALLEGLNVRRRAGGGEGEKGERS